MGLNTPDNRLFAPVEGAEVDQVTLDLLNLQFNDFNNEVVTVAGEEGTVESTITFPMFRHVFKLVSKAENIKEVISLVKE